MGDGYYFLCTRPNLMVLLANCRTRPIWRKPLTTRPRGNVLIQRILSGCLRIKWHGDAVGQECEHHGSRKDKQNDEQYNGPHSLLSAETKDDM